MSLTAEELTGMCERYGGLDRFKNVVEAIRGALKNKGFVVTKFEDFAAACAQFEFSIDSAIDQSALTTKGKEAFKSIIMRKLNHTIEFWETHNITANVCQGDVDILFVPHGVTVVPGSCAYAFQNCASLMWVDPEIDWSEATSMSNLFNGTNQLNNTELRFDLMKTLSLQQMQPKVETVRLSNLGFEGRRFGTLNNSNPFSFSKYVYGMNTSYLNMQNSGSSIIGTNNNCVYVELLGVIRRRNDITYNPVSSYFRSVNDETLWGLCKHAYDYNHKTVNDDGYGRILTLDYTSSDSLDFGFSDAQKQRLEAYFETLHESERRDADGTLCTSVEQYMTAKGWTY